MNEAFYNQMRELSWRRKLSEAEEAELRAWLAGHPEAQAEWEADAGLSEALRRLPDAPVASNFTALVLQAVERETAAETRERRPGRRFWPGRLRWLPRAAIAAILLWGGIFWNERVQAARRVRIARSVATVSEVPSLPTPDVLMNFDAIRRLSQTPPADEQLLMLLQ